MYRPTQASQGGLAAWRAQKNLSVLDFAFQRWVIRVNRRFVVTNRRGDPQRLFDFYEGRGQAENYIKELKNQFKADRLSCSRFAANAFRLVLFALAYQLVNLFRRCLANPWLRRAQVQTLREKLFKVGALITQSTRRYWLHLASGWPYQDLLRDAIRDVALLPAPT